MAAITAAMVKELRVKTDAPMMECKKALTEADGDMAKAEEILRVKLGNKATKAAARIAAEGVVAVYLSDDRKLGAILEVNSETDFVAKNPEFLQMAADAVRAVAEQNPADIEALAACKIGVIVDVIGGNAELSHDVAMHIAAAKPKALDETGVDQAQIEAERRIAIEKAREAGKPEAMLERIAEGTVKKFLKEVTLVNQPFVKDDKKSVGELVKAAGAQIGGYTLFVVGEGIEKRVDDFAAEVAAQVAAAKA